MGYEVFCRGEHAYFVPLVKTKNDGRRQPEIEADKLRKEIEDRGFTFIEADTEIKLTCFATGDDGFEPTAEWSRITQALKERDELAAELERVKAERDAYRSCLIQSGVIFADTPPMDQFVADVIGGALKIEHNEFQSIKSRLPVNADGDVVLWGDEVWYGLLDGTPCGIYAKEIELNPDGRFIVPDGWRILDVQKELHTTAESCRAAHEGKEGENDENI